MRILWITNTIFPEPCKAFGFSHPIFEGWTYSLAKQLIATNKITFAIASVYQGKEIKSLDIEGVLYYLLPTKTRTKYNAQLELDWQQICKQFKPDIIHIQGTESPNGLACMRSCPDLNYIISIQGLIDVCSKYYFAGIKRKEILKCITLRDLIRVDTLFHAKINFRKRGKFETEYILRSQNIIGRTSWDYAHVKAINPNINYHFCNEILRDSFYTASKWDVNNKNNYTIFLSQATEPLKGLHQVLKAITLLKTEFPEIKLRVAGPNILRNTSLWEKVKRSGYGAYIQNLISKFNLNKHVSFIGMLQEDQMISEYLKAHVFICPSSIENSPNSLGEAQLIGVPTISAYVGGIPDMVTHGESGLLYRFEEVEMLAEYIRKVFTNDEMANKLSKNGIQAAEIRHNRQINLDQTLNIYNTIILSFIKKPESII